MKKPSTETIVLIIIIIIAAASYFFIDWSEIGIIDWKSVFGK